MADENKRIHVSSLIAEKLLRTVLYCPCFQYLRQLISMGDKQSDTHALLDAIVGVEERTVKLINKELKSFRESLNKIRLDVDALEEIVKRSCKLENANNIEAELSADEENEWHECQVKNMLDYT